MKNKKRIFLFNNPVNLIKKVENNLCAYLSIQNKSLRICLYIDSVFIKSNEKYLIILHKGSEQKIKITNIYYIKLCTMDGFTFLYYNKDVYIDEKGVI